jgi:hypothetical protein
MDFDRMRNLIIGFFVVIVIMIVLGWGSCAYIVSTVVTNPEGTGQAVGNFADSIKKGYDEATKPE